MLYFGLPAYFNNLRGWFDTSSYKSLSRLYEVVGTNVYYNPVISSKKGSVKYLYNNKEDTYDKYIEKLKNLLPEGFTKVHSVGISVDLNKDFIKNKGLDSKIYKKISLQNNMLFTYDDGLIRSNDFLTLKVEFNDNMITNIMLHPIINLCGAFYTSSLQIFNEGSPIKNSEALVNTIFLVKKIAEECGYSGFYYYTAEYQEKLIDAFIDSGSTKVCEWVNRRSSRNITTWFCQREGVEVK